MKDSTAQQWKIHHGAMLFLVHEQVRGHLLIRRVRVKPVHGGFCVDSGA